MELLDKQMINGLQGGFPLVPEPFTQVGAQWGLSAEAVIARLQALLAQRVISRFGPLYHAERLGGAAWLAALAVPEAVLVRVIAQVNAQPEVAHHYQRSHVLNLWFVVAAETEAGVRAALDRLEQITGYPVYRFPKEREYGVELKLYVREDSGPVQPAPPPEGLRPLPPLLPDVTPLTSLEYRVMRATQAGLPLVPRPYHALAETLHLPPDTVIAALNQMLQRGVIRRVGLAPHPVALGYLANAMSVWDVADAVVDAHGAALARLPWVSHCYRRPRQLPDWPYNLFLMLHAATTAEVAVYAQQVQALLGADCRQHDLLYSTRMLKKTGLRSPQEAPCSA